MKLEVYAFGDLEAVSYVFLESKLEVQRRPSKAILLLYVLLFIGILAVASYNWKSKQKIRSVVVEGNRFLSTSEILKITALVPDSLRFAEVDPSEIRRKILQHDFVSEASVVFSEGETLKITIKERQPIAKILPISTTTAEFTEISYVDKSGRILPLYHEHDPEDLPILLGYIVSEDYNQDKGQVTHQVSEQESRITNASLQPDVISCLDVLSYLKSNDIKTYRAISELSFDSLRNVRLFTTGYNVEFLLGESTTLLDKFQKISTFLDNNRSSEILSYASVIDARWTRQLVVKSRK